MRDRAQPISHPVGHSILLGLLAFSIFEGRASGFALRTDAGGRPLLWGERQLLVLVDPTGMPELPGVLHAIRNAFDEWTAAGVPVQVTVQLAAGEVAERGDHRNVVAWQRAGWKHGPGVVAMTSSLYRSSSGLLTEADVLLNGALSWTTAPELEPSSFDLQNIITHEAGHLLGLEHASDPRAAMFPVSLPGEIVKRRLSPDDRAAAEALRAAYASGRGGRQASGADDGLEESAPGGCSLAGSPSSRGLWVLLLLAALRRLRRSMPCIET